MRIARPFALSLLALGLVGSAVACGQSSGGAASGDGGSPAGDDAGGGVDAPSADGPATGPEGGGSPSDASNHDGASDGGGGSGGDASDGGGPVPALCAGKTVIFRDDFDGTALDSTKWNTKYSFCGTGCCTLSSNAEQECYVPQQVTVQGGALHLVGQPVQGQSLPYASGMISSGPVNGGTPKFDFQYGYFEARVKIPAGQGLWPAFWTGNSDGSWPPEIDVMEILGNAPNTWYGTVHYSTPQQMNNGDGTSWMGPDFSQGWHTFGVMWQPSLLVWTIDGVERKRVTAANEVQTKRAFLMADLAVGGSWPGDPDGGTTFPADYQIDYIVVCQ